ncbi:olfactory receptor 10G7-like [Microcaecilia unicolor]|uniref:Olfactory receptor n=1 Tax=Microcaecilia unicolor TaxID=1415580 RepID=A0A6P7WWE3_9AMPH|nr:olfactory receptor 10G7-like [Microcaecilia unicolor]
MHFIPSSGSRLHLSAPVETQNDTVSLSFNYFFYFSFCFCFPTADEVEGMAVRNETRVTQFILLGFSSNPDLQIVLFVFFLVMYLGTIAGNLLIMITIYVDSQLHSPMYFFLSNLSFIDVFFSTVTIPRALVNFLSPSKAISFRDCIAQLFFLHFIGGTECLHLSLMAYDRYVAICHPLRYTTIMNPRACLLLVVSTWTLGLIHAFAQVFPTIHMPFCGPNKIDHFFCETHALYLLVCSSSLFIEIVDMVNSGFLTLSCCLVVFISYTYIISTVLKIRSAEGRQKAFSTCASHVLVVTIHFGSSVFIYLRPSVTFAADKPLSVFYAIVTPFLNPFIYTLRNKEVKKAMKKLGGSVFSKDTQKLKRNHLAVTD